MKPTTRKILIAAIALMIVGGVLTAVGSVLGGGLRNWPTNVGNYIRFDFPWNHSNRGRFWSSDDFTDKGESLDPFTGIVMDTDIGEISIEYGNEYRLDFYDYVMDEVRWSVDNGRLAIYDDYDDYHGRSIEPNVDIDTRIVITVPYGVTLDFINIEHDLGSVKQDVAVAGNEVFYYLDLGSLYVKDIKANSSTFNLNLGDLEADNIITKKLNMDLDLGSGTLTNVTAQNIEAECDLGSLDLELIGRPDDYNYNLGVNLGSILYNGNKLHEESSRNDSSRPNYLDATLSLGDLTVTFKNAPSPSVPALDGSSESAPSSDATSSSDAPSSNSSSSFDASSSTQGA